MPQFSVGQNIVHPNHGVGLIIGRAKMDLIDGFEKYYQIKFKAKRLTVHVPVKSMEEIGVRRVMSEERLDRVLDILRDEPQKLPKHYKARRSKIEDLLKDGYPAQVAEAVRELTWHQQKTDLNTTDTRLLSQGKELLINEIATATDIEKREARQVIDEALAEAIELKEELKAQAEPA